MFVSDMNPATTPMPFVRVVLKYPVSVLFFRGYAGVCIPLKDCTNFIGEKHIFRILKSTPYILLLCFGYTVLSCVIIILIVANSLLAAF